MAVTLFSKVATSRVQARLCNLKMEIGVVWWLDLLRGLDSILLQER